MSTIELFSLSLLLQQLMEGFRFNRIQRIRDNAIKIHYFSPDKKGLFLCSIQGSTQQPYIIFIDFHHHFIYHDCPDFIGRETFCKHLGKITLALPRQFQHQIIQYYENQAYFTNISRINHEDQQYMANLDCTYQKYLESDFLEDFLDHLSYFEQNNYPIYETFLHQCLVALIQEFPSRFRTLIQNFLHQLLTFKKFLLNCGELHPVLLDNMNLY
jgi:hypothetical protein